MEQHGGDRDAVTRRWNGALLLERDRREDQLEIGRRERRIGAKEGGRLGDVGRERAAAREADAYLRRAVTLALECQDEDELRGALAAAARLRAAARRRQLRCARYS